MPWGFPTWIGRLTKGKHNPPRKVFQGRTLPEEWRFRRNQFLDAFFPVKEDDLKEFPDGDDPFPLELPPPKPKRKR